MTRVAPALVLDHEGGPRAAYRVTAFNYREEDGPMGRLPGKCVEDLRAWRDSTSLDDDTSVLSLGIPSP